MTRVFATRVAERLRVASVGLPLAAASLLGLAGLLFNIWGLSALSAALTLWASYLWPLSRSDRAQLAAGPDGLALDGLGRISWPSVASVRFEPRRSGRGGVLRVSLSAPIRLALAVDERARLPRALQAKIWRLTGPQSLTVALGGLEDEPAAIVAAIRELSGKPIVT